MAKKQTAKFGISDVAEVLTQRYGLNKKHAGIVSKAVLALIQARVKKGDAFAAVGFGTLQLVATKARTGRNPGTGEPIKIAASKRIKFKASKGTLELPEPYTPKPVAVKTEKLAAKPVAKKAAPKKPVAKKAVAKKAVAKKAAKPTPKKVVAKKPVKK